MSKKFYSFSYSELLYKMDKTSWPYSTPRLDLIWIEHHLHRLLPAQHLINANLSPGSFLRLPLCTMLYC